MQFCIMGKLNFHDFDFSFKSKENKTYIFDPIRKMVSSNRGMGCQNCIQFLLKTKNVPLGFIQVEKN